jgi:hypothetical protein
MKVGNVILTRILFLAIFELMILLISFKWSHLLNVSDKTPQGLVTIFFSHEYFLEQTVFLLK